MYTSKPDFLGVFWVMQPRAIVVALATAALAYVANLFLSTTTLNASIDDGGNTEELVDSFLDFATSVNYQLRDLDGPRGRALQAALHHVPPSPAFDDGGSRSFSDSRWVVPACTALEVADASSCIRLLTDSSNPLRAQRIAQVVAFLRRLRTSLPPRDPSLHANTHRAGSSVVVVGGGPAGLISGLAAAQAGSNVLLLERRTAFERSVWFDLSTDDIGSDGRSSSDHYLQSSSVGDGLGGVGPTQALLESWGFGFQRAQVQRQSDAGDERSTSLAESSDVGSCDADSDRAANSGMGCRNAGDMGEVDVSTNSVSEIVTVRCAELESFLAKVLFLAGATLAFGVEGLGPCLASPPATGFKHSKSNSRSDSSRDAWMVVAMARRNSKYWIAQGNEDSGSSAHSTGGNTPVLASAGFLPGNFSLAARTSCDILRAAVTDKNIHSRERTKNGLGEASSRGNVGEGEVREVLITAPFGVLVGADGAKSRVRASLNCSMRSVSTFQLPVPRSSQQSELAQTLEVDVGEAVRFPTAILRFATDATTGRCPRLRSEILDPFAIQAAVPEVTSVFKRFFRGHCELQIAFDAVTAAAVVPPEGRSEKAGVAHQAIASADSSVATIASTALPLPWPLLVRVCNFLFEDPFPDELSLRRHLMHCGENSIKDNSSTTTGLSCGASMHVMPIQRVGPAAVVPLLSSSRNGKNSAHNDNATAVAVLVGDSAVTALYRLGVGVNAIFAGLADLRRAFVRGRLVREAKPTRMGVGPRFLAAWEQHFAPVYTKRLWRVSNAQAAAAFWESSCGLVVYRDELWRLALPAGGSENKAAQYEGPLHPLLALKSCSNSSELRPWSWRLL